ncbi:hypothetical protein SM139_1712 [Stenotrophomonas maltophilia]|nr:hypothetical protein SM139_1712 [Stenotrophomonas maltophilia]
MMPICTVDRKLSGFSDSSSALAARLEVAAICFRRLLREVMTDISDMAKNPFSRTSAKTIRIISNTGVVPGWWQGGRVLAMAAGAQERGPARRWGIRVVVHRMRPKARWHLSKGAWQGCNRLFRFGVPSPGKGAGIPEMVI